MKKIFIPIIIGFVCVFNITASDYIFNLLDYVEENNSQTRFDDALAQALSDAENANGGTVIIPPGSYRFNNPINVPVGVCLKGASDRPHTTTPSGQGTWIISYYGYKVSEGDPFITLQQGATLSSLTIFYPEQQSNNIQPFPWTISINGSDCNILDLTIANAYRAVIVKGGRHLIRNLNMCALVTGIQINESLDVGRLENVHIHESFWRPLCKSYDSNAWENITEFTKYNLTGFNIIASDWEQITNCFVIYAKIGYKIGDSNMIYHSNIPDDENILPLEPSVSLNGGGCDLSVCAILIERNSGFRTSNAQFIGAIDILSSNQGSVSISNSTIDIFHNIENLSNVKNAGSGTLLIANCSFPQKINNWSIPTKITCLNNSITSLSNCDFQIIPIGVRLEEYGLSTVPKQYVFDIQDNSRLQCSNIIIRGVESNYTYKANFGQNTYVHLDRPLLIR